MTCSVNFVVAETTETDATAKTQTSGEPIAGSLVYPVESAIDISNAFSGPSLKMNIDFES